MAGGARCPPAPPAAVFSGFLPPLFTAAVRTGAASAAVHGISSLVLFPHPTRVREQVGSSRHEKWQSRHSTTHQERIHNCTYELASFFQPAADALAAWLTFHLLIFIQSVYPKADDSCASTSYACSY
jgi:hypothetical protein